MYDDDEEGGKDRDFDLDDEIERGMLVKYYSFLLIFGNSDFAHLYSVSTCLLLLLQRIIHNYTPTRKYKDNLSCTSMRVSQPSVGFLARTCSLSGDDWEHEEIFTDDEALDIDPEERADLTDPEIPAPRKIKQVDKITHTFAHTIG